MLIQPNWTFTRAAWHNISLHALLPSNFCHLSKYMLACYCMIRFVLSRNSYRFSWWSTSILLLRGNILPCFIFPHIRCYVAKTHSLLCFRTSNHCRVAHCYAVKNEFHHFFHALQLVAWYKFSLVLMLFICSVWLEFVEQLFFWENTMRFS